LVKKGLRFGGYLVVALIIGSGVFFLAATQVYSIPTWWLASFMHPESVLPAPGTFVVVVSPSNPSQLGQQETATVTDSSTQTPIEGANLTVFYGGGPVFSTSTNSRGIAVFSYAGSPTVISFEKSGYTSQMAVLPNAPEQWVNGIDLSAAAGAFSGLVSLAGLILQWRVRQSPRKQSRGSRSKKR
jgi:hypothetical protein